METGKAAAEAAVVAAAAGSAPCAVSAAGGASIVNNCCRQSFSAQWLDYCAMQSLAACAVVCLLTVGAAAMTYNKPVVGLGCRSGNYII